MGSETAKKIAGLSQDSKWEILNYPNPQGLHPIEKSWRDFARQLKEVIMDLIEPSIKLCPDCGQPMLPEGMKKLPDEFDHARGCPREELAPR